MTTHSSIEGSFLGMATSIRRWFHGKSCHAHTEVNLSKRGYFSFGIDLFDEEEDFSIHLRLIWVWMSFSFRAEWKWLAALRKIVRGANYAGRRLVQCSYFEHSINFHFWWTECDKAKWRGISTHAYMPWHSQWVKTEVLSIDLKRAVHTERRRSGIDWSVTHREREKAKAENSIVVPYTYTRESGEVQNRKATVTVERRSWGYKWLPLPLHSNTCIDVQFDGEVGEGTGSWKGGTIGCGYDMLPCEMPIETLRRMEHYRKFNR